MKILDIPIQLSEDYQLTDEPTRLQTVKDIRKWEAEGDTDDATPLQKNYAKLHSNPLLKAILPIVYIFIRKAFNEIMNPELKERYSDRFD